MASIAAVQADAGHRVALLQGGGAEATRMAREAFGEFPGFRQVDLQDSPWWGWGGRIDFAADAVHVHGLWEPLLQGTLARAQRRGIHTVLTPHGMSSPWQDRRYRWVKAGLRGPLGYERRWRKVSRIHVLSAAEEAHWRQRGINRLSCISNGLFPAEMSESKAPPRWAGPPAGTPFVLFLGRLAAQKAPELLLEAFAEIAAGVPRLHLVFAGPDYGLERGLRETVRRRKLEHRVWFPGWLDAPTKWAALRHAAMLAHPSRSEGHSLSLVEAAFAGCPSLLSRGAGFPELVEAGGATGFDGSTADLAGHMRRLIDDSVLRNTISRRAADLARREYTWEARLPRLMRMYRPIST